MASGPSERRLAPLARAAWLLITAPACLLFAGLACLLFAGTGFAHEDHASSPPRLFEPPAAGSYELPIIDRVGEHVLVDETGSAASLPELGEEQVGIVSFVYADCGQACPLAFSVLQRLDRELARTPALAGRVRLASVSFDPARDDPARMAELKQALAPKGDWRFLTAPSQPALEPVLVDYGQDVRRSLGEDGDVVGHTLRVYLVDGAGAVRNVYSAGFLDAEILRNDAATVLGVAPEALPPAGSR